MPDSGEGDLDPASLLELYGALRLTRTAEEHLEPLEREGRAHRNGQGSLGREAGAVGAAYALRRRCDGTGDVLAPSEHATGATLLFGGALSDFYLQRAARAESPTGGKEADLDWVDLERGIVGPISPPGTMVAVMAGICLTFNLRQEKRVGIVFYGDGATSSGAWHEGLNFAAVQRCPMIVVVEVNQGASSTSSGASTRLTSFTRKAKGYGIGAESVDGSDVIAVHNAVRRAAERARADGGVQLVEIRYFPRTGRDRDEGEDHTDPVVLREWTKKDPIGRFRGFLVHSGVATEDDLARIDAEISELCRTEAEAAIGATTPVGRFALDDVYTDVPIPQPWTRRDDPDPRRSRKVD